MSPAVATGGFSKNIFRNIMRKFIFTSLLAAVVGLGLVEF